MKYTLLGFIYLFALFMAWSGFGLMGVAYVLIVPVPLVLFSYLIQKSKKEGGAKKQSELNWWTSPVPYLSIILIGYIAFHVFF